MDERKTTVFIVEGKEREPLYLNRMLDVFFKSSKSRFEIISLCDNLYVLWKKLKEGNFQADTIHALRKYFPESLDGHEDLMKSSPGLIYLFFDYDPQNFKKSLDGREVGDALTDMLGTFSDPTRFGKLYVSYPMVEATRDWMADSCNVYTECILSNDDAPRYKESSVQNNTHVAVEKYGMPEWRGEIENFAMRVGCLFGLDEAPDYKYYDGKVSPAAIYEREKRYVNSGEFFVLSSIPEFLLDYYLEDFWDSVIKTYRLKHDHCVKGRT